MLAKWQPANKIKSIPISELIVQNFACTNPTHNSSFLACANILHGPCMKSTEYDTLTCCCNNSVHIAFFVKNTCFIASCYTDKHIETLKTKHPLIECEHTLAKYRNQIDWWKLLWTVRWSGERIRVWQVHNQRKMWPERPYIYSWTADSPKNH